LKTLLISGFDNTCISVHAYQVKDRIQIIRVIDLVCAECEWMSTKKFIPTFQWLHAFSETKCQSHLLLVAEYADEPIGWCRLFPEECLEARKFVELGIGLLPDYRNQKIGSGLLQLAFHWAKNSGVDRIDLSAHNDNRRALHLFEKFGFHAVCVDGNCLMMSAKV
jgi:RimJ/RimL family protein N-acetyltransferase